MASFSYNIDLMLGKNKLDNEIWDGSVQMAFSGVPIEKMSREADSVEVIVATTKEDENQADVSAEDVVEDCKCKK
ncbi:hypothetical protein [[Clostridium] symbiosum]|nr:hypothetical protein [[Clostridium] symbiosum]